MPITTKTGDKGQTFFIGQKRVLKSHPLIEVYGQIDELQAFIGWLRTKLKDKKQSNFLISIEKDLYLIMSYLNQTKNNLAFIKKRVLVIEKKIILKEKKLPKFDRFVVPGKNETSAIYHLCRVVCRRTERQLVSAWQRTKNQRLLDVVPYFNRLSDFLFLWAEK